MKKNTKEPQDLINDALTAGVRAIICRDSDSQRAIHAAITAAKAHSEVKVQVITSTSRPIPMPTGKTFTAWSSLTRRAANIAPIAMPTATHAVSFAALLMS